MRASADFKKDSGPAAKVDVQQVFNPIAEMRNFILVICVIVLLFLGFIASAAANSIAKPIEDLRKGTEIIGNGNFDHKVAIKTSDEIGQLSRAFDQMVVDLKKIMVSRGELEKEIIRRKKIEETNLKLSRAVEQSPAVIVITDPEGTIEYVNPAFERVTGYSAQEAIGKNPRILKSGYQPNAFYKNLWDTIKSGKVWRGEFNNRTKSGAVIWEAASIAPIKDDQGNVYAFVAVKEDTTERRHREDHLRRLRAELERSNQELEQFAYVTSHDLQEPLRMIASYTQLLEKRYNDLLDEKGKKYIYFAVDGVNRMQQLISDLLAFSRVGTKDKELIETDLNLVYEKAIKNLEIAIKENNAKILCDPLPVVTGDDVQLIQLFQNLVGNALKFHGEAAPEVQIHGQDHGNEWLFCVSDNGIGLDEKYKDRIFIIFQRLHTKDEYKGTGIGLAVCKKIVERHGGKIWVESKPGQGAKFYFTIPKEQKKKMGEMFMDDGLISI